MPSDGERRKRDDHSGERMSTRLQGDDRRRGELSSDRKALYYLGGGLMALGFLLFLTPFFSIGCASSNGFESSTSLGHTYASSRSDPGMVPSIIGFVMIAVGQLLRSIGARGMRGSGVILDPDGARDDLAPYSRMAGGMLSDAVEASGLDLGRRDDEPEVMVRCLACDELNEEDSKFCQECGQPIRRG